MVALFFTIEGPHSRQAGRMSSTSKHSVYNRGEGTGKCSKKLPFRKRKDGECGHWSTALIKFCPVDMVRTLGPSTGLSALLRQSGNSHFDSAFWENLPRSLSSVDLDISSPRRGL